MVNYILFSASMGGWLTRNATYHSDPDKALRLERDEALRLCTGHTITTRHDPSIEFGMIPVNIDDLEEVRAMVKA